MNADFVEGWKAARAYWEQHNCSLTPLPPQKVEPEKASEGIGSPAPPPPPKHDEDED